MKLLKVLGVILLTGLSLAGRAQIFSQNIVGYLNLELYAGNNWMGNPLASSDDTLNTIFQPGVPAGTTFSEWDAAAQQYLPPSVYDPITGWSINYTWGYGQGGLVNTPASFVNTFVGTVWSGFDPTIGTFVPPLVPDDGAQLLTSVVPLPATFYDVLGRDPQNGDSVTILDGPSQSFTTTVYDNGIWNNGTPLLAIGQAAIFDSDNSFNPDAIPTPEPAGIELAGMGLALLGVRRKSKWFA